MERLKVSSAVRPIYGSLGIKRLITVRHVFLSVSNKTVYWWVTSNSCVMNDTSSQIDPHEYASSQSVYGSNTRINNIKMN